MSFAPGPTIALGSLVGSLGLFYLWLPFSILNPFEVDWALHHDWGTNYLGWRAFCLDEWHLPLLWTRFGLWPTGFVIAFSDSIPLLSLPLKLTRTVTGCGFQFLGPFLLSSVFLMILVGALIFRRLGWSVPDALLAALLVALAPALFHRGHHVTLTAHWLILLCVLGLLSPKGRLAFFFVLAQLAILISMYFMPIVLWFALINGTFKDGRLRPGTLARSAAHVVLIAAGVLASLYALGFFHADGAARGFGYYSMNVLGPINPEGRSRFLPDLPIGQPGQLYEGFQYVGLGWMCAMLIGLFCWWRQSGRDAASKLRGALLIGTAFLFAAAALSNKIYIGPWLVAEFPLVFPLSLIAGIFRTSGRYFWVASYVAIIAALVQIGLRLRPPYRTMTIAALVALQLADVKLPYRVPADLDIMLMSRATGRSAADDLAARGVGVVQIRNEDFEHYAPLVDALIERDIAITYWYVARFPRGHVHATTAEVLQNGGAFVSARPEECRAKAAELRGTASAAYSDGWCSVHHEPGASAGRSGVSPAAESDNGEARSSGG
ncbi:MAG TPA: DUF6311 domain-containing protein [Beijerinckiaceae bacterium]|nr:hypothetical protein [Microvirga sp.]HZB37387.1 DUF6311 domain-containing protein [Beijerinckiaceae bacterium]